MEFKTCRICLDITATVSIFDKQNDDQYSAMVMRCANVDVVEGDGLPDGICVRCTVELATSYEFVRKCETSDRTLRRANVNVSGSSNDIKPKIEIEIKLEPLEYLDTRHVDQDSIDLSSIYNTKISCDSHDDIKTIKGKQCKIDECKSGLIRRGIKAASINSGMESHMRTCIGKKPFACDSCSTSFNSKGLLKRHITVHHTPRDRKFICETCGSCFFSKNDIRNHMSVHTDERPYPCPYCSKTFRQMASVIRHKRMHTGEKPFSCTICCKGFIDKSHLSRHMYVHSEEKKFTCQLCNRSVKTRNALTAHMRKHSSEKQFICGFCGMTFSLKSNLQTHKKKIHSEKSGKCSVCSKKFPDLKAHMHKHTGEKLFLCDLCDQPYASKRSLANHMSFKHNHASKFKCSKVECSMSFPTARMLEYHMLKQHTDHTPYICHHCSREFFTNSDLSRHLKSHTQPHGCSTVEPRIFKPVLTGATVIHPIICPTVDKK